jgi:hypothetical protein
MKDINKNAHNFYKKPVDISIFPIRKTKKHLKGVSLSFQSFRKFSWSKPDFISEP